MAIRFNPVSILFEKSWTVIYPDAQGYREKFFELCKDSIKQVNFPDINVSIEDFKTGRGWFSTKETTPMVFVKFSESKLKNLSIFFRAQQFGNIMHYSLFETIDIDLSGENKNETEMKIRKKCKNLLQYEEYCSFIQFGKSVFENVIQSLDNNREQ